MAQEYEDEFEELDQESDETYLNNMFMILILDDRKFAIPVSFIREIQLLPEITPLPDCPTYIKGVIKLRERVMTIVDTRKYFGLRAHEEIDNDFLNMLAARKQDHINWLNALYDAIENNHEFKLSRDPHGCAFGKWYDNFKTTDIGLNAYLAQFDNPHKRIHAVANKAFDALDKEGKASAHKIIQNAKDNELVVMVKLFDNAGEVLRESRKELMVVIEYNEIYWGFTFDNIERIITIDLDKVEKHDLVDNSNIDGVYTHEEEVIILLNMDKLMNFK